MEITDLIKGIALALVLYCAAILISSIIVSVTGNWWYSPLIIFMSNILIFGIIVPDIESMYD